MNRIGEASGVSNDARGYLHAVRWDRRDAVTDLSNGADTFTNAVDLNDHGTAIGITSVNGCDSGRCAAVRWDRSGHAKTLASPPGTNYVEAIAINNRDMAIGYVTMVGGSWTTVRWDRRGTITDLSATARKPYPYGLNDSGVIVGNAEFTEGISHATRWDVRGQASDLGALFDGANSRATAINNAGTVVGFSSTTDGWWHAVLWRQGR
ncbi:hypothetical protein GCM10029964_096800 [Kibdelosporangium lantanae]